MLNTEEKFREMYEKYKNLIMKVAYDLTEDYHTAQDICQRVFEKLYGYQEHVDEERVRAWLVVIAANEARDYCPQRRTVYDPPQRYCRDGVPDGM